MPQKSLPPAVEAPGSLGYGFSEWVGGPSKGADREKSWHVRACSPGGRGAWIVRVRVFRMGRRPQQGGRPGEILARQPRCLPIPRQRPPGPSCRTPTLPWPRVAEPRRWGVAPTPMFADPPAAPPRPELPNPDIAVAEGCRTPTLLGALPAGTRRQDKSTPHAPASSNRSGHVRHRQLFHRPRCPASRNTPSGQVDATRTGIEQSFRARATPSAAALLPMRELHRQIQQPVNLSVRQGDEIVYVERAL